MMPGKEIVFDTLKRWILSSTSDAQLETCRVAVHDLLYIRFGDDEGAGELKFLIEKLKDTCTGRPDGAVTAKSSLRVPTQNNGRCKLFE